MMGRSHALSGWCAGLAAAPVLGLDTLAQVVPFAATTAGYALLPDLDHPGASASRLLGPVTGLLSRAVRAGSAALYAATKGPRDEDCTGTHRHASHTLAAALLLGGLAVLAAGLGGSWAVAGVAVFGLLLAVDVLGDWLLLVLAAAGLLWAGTWHAETPAAPAAVVHAGLAEVGSWIGAAVALGMLVHCLGDTLTLSGCPWLWPIRIAGETWYEIRPPRGLRVRTDGRFEKWVMVPALTAGAVLLLPGAWTFAQNTLTGLFATATAHTAR